MTKKNKPNRDTNVLAALHLLKQQETIMGRVGFKRSDFARWLGVSKPTAIKVVEECVQVGYFVRYEEILNNGATIYTYYTNRNFPLIDAKGLNQASFDAYVEVRKYVVGDAWKLWGINHE